MKMATVDLDKIKVNKEKLESIILFPGTLKELNSCRKTRESGVRYRMERDFGIKLEIFDYNNLMGDYSSPDMIFKQVLYENGFKGVVNYSDRYIQGEKSLYVLCDGIAISEKECWWKKYFKKESTS